MSYSTNRLDDRIVELLKNGAVGLLPSDTIYGLSAVALNKDAVERVHELKRRDGNKPLIVLIANIKQLKELGLSKEQSELVEYYWPAALSVIFEAENIPGWLQLRSSSLAVRMPDNQELRDLIAKTGPIVSTSANLQGKKPAASVKEAKNYFNEHLDFYVDVGELNGQASTLVKIEKNKLKVVRQGSYSLPEPKIV
jgi:L-threonylcarbamoyladenylate synthase